MGNIRSKYKLYQWVEVHGAIEWNEIESQSIWIITVGHLMFMGVDAAGVEYSAVGYIDYGVIDDIVESTLELLCNEILLIKSKKSA